MSSITYRLRKAYRVMIIIVALSVIGILVEFLFAYLSSSMILYTDTVHWIIDTVLEIFILFSLYFAARIYRKFSWGALYLESISMFIVVLAIFMVYGYLFIDYVNLFVLSSSNSVRVTSTNPYLSLVTTFGGILTLISLYIQQRSYRILKLDIIKMDYRHAILDTISSIIATIGLYLTSITNSVVIEFITMISIMFFIFHSIINYFRDSILTLIGTNVDPELRYKLYKSISSINYIDVKDINIRKIGSFYIVRIIVLISPNTTIADAHRLRRKIISLCRGISELIYHVDVIFYPKRKLKRIKKLDIGKNR